MESRILSIDVSLRREPGIERAYAWLSDGTVIGYRDLTTGRDHPVDEQHRDSLRVAVEEWLSEYGVPCGPPSADGVPEQPGGGLLARWRARRRARRAAAARREWLLDHPAWRVPIDAPHGGWRDLARNRPGQELWEHAGSMQPARWFDVAERQRQRAWTTGALGEELVADRLWRIARPGAWRVLHSIPVGRRGADIDHLLIGPGGVFTINTKHHRGAAIWLSERATLVNGQRQPYLRNARHEAERAARLLGRAVDGSVHVHPLLVFVAPRSFTVKATSHDVTALTDRGLQRWITRLPVVMTPEQVDELYTVARRSSTWVESPARG